MKTPISHALKLAIAALCAVLLQGCSSFPEDTVVCDLPATKNVDVLFDTVEERLATPSCQFRYESYFDRLIASAKASPGPDNEARFAQLMRSSIERGVISKRRGQELFSRYFDPEFYAVKTDARNVCSSLQDKSELYAAMSAELDDKREGLLEILGDEPRFRQAQHHYADLKTVFDATYSACGTTL